MWGIVLKEIGVSSSQFFTWRYPFSSSYYVIAAILSAMVRILLGRSLKFSYAFAGEDRNIESILKPLMTKNGFYVDVGCNHPIFLSNTYLLYRRGWRGVCIDANETLIGMYRKRRPRDKAVNALVSDKEVEVDFFLVQNNVLSTIDATIAEGYKNEGLKISETELVSRRLTSVLKECNAPKHFDLLTIDTEEHDYEVLLSLDLNQYVPRLIVVEDESFDTNLPSSNDVYVYLIANDYRLAGYLLKNLYFLKNKS